MNLRSLVLTLPFLGLATLAGCSSDDGSSATSAPVIERLDVPEQTTQLTAQGQSGPGIVLTLTAHDDSAGLSALHVVFTELGAEQVVQIPNAPTTLTDQKIELVFLNAPKGAHPLGFYLTDAKNQKSASVDKTVTVP